MLEIIFFRNVFPQRNAIPQETVLPIQAVIAPSQLPNKNPQPNVKTAKDPAIAKILVIIYKPIIVRLPQKPKSYFLFGDLMKKI